MIADLKPVTPHPEWEQRVLARCHRQLANRRRRTLLRRIAEAAAAAAVGSYLAAMFQQAMRFAGLL